MPDPVFAAEMAALTAARREREQGRVGDGMAAWGARGEGDASWMDFSGPKVPIEGPDRGPSFTGWDRPLHRHNGTSECLETVAGGIRLTPRGDDPEVPEPGWVKCSHNGVRFHFHGERLMAHFSGDRKACPGTPA